MLDTELLTVQKHLKNAGSSVNYASAVIGKWHLAGGNSQNLTHSIESGVDYYAGTIEGVIDDYYSWPLTANGATETSTVYHTTAMTDLAIDWVAAQNSPWFLWLAYIAPHEPFHAPPSALHTRNLSGEATDIQNNSRQYYLAAIEAMDTEIGRLLASIPTETLDNTLIVFIGDNGTPRQVIDLASYPRTHSKGTLYEGGIRVPMVVSGAGVTRFNEREPALVNTVDLFATFAAVAQLPEPENLDSQSFLPLLSESGASTCRPNLVMSHFAQIEMSHSRPVTARLSRRFGNTGVACHGTRGVVNNEFGRGRSITDYPENLGPATKDHGSSQAARAWSTTDGSTCGCLQGPGCPGPHF